MLKRIVTSSLRRFGYRLERVDEPIDESLLVSPSVIFDVGAHRGESIRRYRRLFPNVTIHSFEPHPESFGVLSKVAQADENAHSHRLALGDEPGEATFYASPVRTATNSLFPRPRGGRRYYPEDAELTETLKVPVDTLDAVCDRLGVAPDILKLDVQGSELLVLRGGKGVLSSGAVSVITSEMIFVPHYEGGVLYYELAEFLTHFDYSLWALVHMVRAGNGQIRFADAIFVSESIRDTVNGMH